MTDMNRAHVAIWLSLAIWLMVLSAVKAHGQLPDTPSVSMGVSASKSKSLCYQGSTDAQNQFMYVEVDCASIPKYTFPSDATSVRLTPASPGFFTLLPNRTFKQTLTSPWFIVPNVLSGLASVANVTRSRRAGAGYADSMGTWGATVGISFFLDKYISRAFGVGVAGYDGIVRTVGAANGTYQ
jgi:hypothetical protein